MDYFIRDPKLHSIIREIAQHVDEYYNSKKTYLAASWGFEVRPGEKTNFHDHHEAILTDQNAYENYLHEYLYEMYY